MLMLLRLLWHRVIKTKLGEHTIAQLILKKEFKSWNDMGICKRVFNILRKQ